MQNNNLLPLETLLSTLSSNSSGFPFNTNNYFDRYSSIKTIISDKILCWVNEGLAQENGIYTDHGTKHISRVIQYAGELLGCKAQPNEQPTPQLLNPYEIFVLLVAIFVHDVGNLEGRNNHEGKAFNFLKEFCINNLHDVVEAKLIANIAKAHGGKYVQSNSQETRDTIKVLTESEDYGGITYRPRLLAGLLRLADEICEDRSRSPNSQLNQDILKPQNLIYHKYAQSIRSVLVDHAANVIRIKYELQSSDLQTRYLTQRTKKYLIDFLFERLDKMNQERIYCSRFISSIVRLSGIRASIDILNADYDTIVTQPIDIEDDGYPIIKKRIADRYPEWKGKQLKQRFKKRKLHG